MTSHQQHPKTATAIRAIFVEKTSGHGRDNSLGSVDLVDLLKILTSGSNIFLSGLSVFISGSNIFTSGESDFVEGANAALQATCRRQQRSSRFWLAARPSRRRLQTAVRRVCWALEVTVLRDSHGSYVALLAEANRKRQSCATCVGG